MAIIGGLGEVSLTKTAGRRGQSVLTGSIALDGTNPTSVATPFRSITAANLTLNKSGAPGTSTIQLSWFVESATKNQLDIYAWKPSAAGTTTTVASDGTETVSYIVTGLL